MPCRQANLPHCPKLLLWSVIVVILLTPHAFVISGHITVPLATNVRYMVTMGLISMATMVNTTFLSMIWMVSGTLILIVCQWPEHQTRTTPEEVDPSEGGFMSHVSLLFHPVLSISIHLLLSVLASSIRLTLFIISNQLSPWLKWIALSVLYQQDILLLRTPAVPYN